MIHEDQGDASISEIAAEIGTSKIEVDNILFKLKYYFKYPEILDNEDMLVSSYIKEFKTNGQEAARKEVERRIKLAKYIRDLKRDNKN